MLNQKEQTAKPFDLSFDFTNLKEGSIYGFGSTLDAFATAFDLSTEEDFHSNSVDFESETVKNSFESFDFDRLTADELNADRIPEESIRAWLNADTLGWYDQKSLKQEALDNELLFGDHLDYSHHDLFEQIVEGYKSDLEDCLYSDREELPKPLYEKIQEDLDWSMDYYYREYLNGDRSNDGVLDQISKELTGERGHVGWDKENNTIILTDLDEYIIREIMSYDLPDDEPIPSKDEIKSYIQNLILRKAAEVSEYHRRKAEAMRIDYERVAEYKAEQAKEEKARKLKEAKERAKQAKQAK